MAYLEKATPVLLPSLLMLCTQYGITFHVSQLMRCKKSPYNER